ncbi:hypothetical protein [Bradyrhizobium sp. URHD0069]|uniref:hypothetical protein n=1 Tax=Bradyrhizobium sp. URHD0069 TaxID=1380355 RepID=UPI000497DE8A|nr:hypothetical protein [Bradyrhizobium sp. URHD0069]
MQPTNGNSTPNEPAQYLTLGWQFLKVARHRRDGSGPSLIKLTRAVRYGRSALDVWMAVHDHAATQHAK